MVVFRCTQRVLRRFRLQPSDTDGVSSGVLGDWYANLFNVGPYGYVLCQSERTLLPVILPARNESFPAEFGSTLAKVLHTLGVPAETVTQEAGAAHEIRIARTRSRHVLGAMNDFALHAQVYLSHARSDDPALEACLKLAEMPSKPIGYDSPGRLVLSLFRSPGVH